jgi:Family of unknown function (DUF6049)
MTPSRRRSIVALAAPVLLALLALGPLSAGLGAPNAVAAVDEATLPIQIHLNTLRPVAPQPGDVLVVSGTLTNVSGAPVSNMALNLQLSNAVDSRSEFDAYAADPDGNLDNLLPIPSTDTVAQQTTLAPAASEPFELSLNLDQNERNALLLTDAWQVRELGIQVTGTGDLDSNTVGQLRTFLPWAPRNTVGNGLPTQVAWVWPLVDRPHRTANGTWFDDTLAPELGPKGRLTGLLNAGSAAEDQSPLGHNPKTQNVPITWAIDPMLVGDVQAMSAGYRVQAGNGTTAGTGTSAAKQWLSGLQAATTRSDASVLPLPYADPDVVAAVREPGFATAIGVATSNGRTLLGGALSGAKLLPYGWPLNGLANQPAVNALTASGDTTLVLADNAVPTDGQPAVTPSAHTLISTNDGDVETLLSDSGLDADVDNGVDNPNGTRLSLQQFLAETLMIQAELPGEQRDLVVAPDRRWDPSPSYAAKLLADTGKAPWIQPVTLRTVRQSAVYTKVARNPLTYPPSARHDELSPSYLAAVASLRDQIGDLNAILPQGTPQIRSYTTIAQQALSSAWRDQRGLANTQLAALRNTVQAQMQEVSITSHANSYVTLTSHGGNVPVTVSNNLGTTVHVTVQLKANQGRLALSQGGRVNNVAIAAHQQTVVHVHAAAKTSGVFTVHVQLLTPKGRSYGPSVQLFVRSTVYGTITLVITGAATAALMVAVAIRLTRRALAARRSTAAAST